MLVTDLKIGGTPLDVYRLATSLDRSDFEVHVACLSPPGAVSDMLQQAGIPAFACDACGAWDLGALRRLRRVIAAVRPDVLHAFLVHANTAACVLGPLAAVPWGRIVTEILTVETEHRWHLALANVTCRLSHRVVGNSPAVVEHLKRYAHIPAGRLVTIPGGVNVERFAGATPIARPALNVPAEARLLLWVGRFDPVKGLDDLVDALSMLDDRGVYLALAGEGPYETIVRRGVARAGLGDRVRFLGRRDDVPSLLAAADVFVLPSHTEGLPNALLEAMAAGRPIVTTDIPGCRGLITDGVSGLLTPPKRPDELSRRIRRLIDDPDLAARLGRAARQRVAKDFSERAMVGRYARLYRSIAGRGSPVGA
jgi:glycosyltransferase involved in cell wall biosynthesis